MMQDIAIVVPVRLAATRFPGKPLYKIRGKPLILWTGERITEQAPDFPLYFAVEDESVAILLEGWGFDVVRTSNNHSSGTDRIAEANETIRAKHIINVQGDEPTVTGKQIKALGDLIRGEPVMGTLATPFLTEEDFCDSDKVKVVIDSNHNALYFSRAPIPFSRQQRGRLDVNWLRENHCFWHLGMYAYTADFLQLFQELPRGCLEMIEMLEQLRALENGFKVAVGITDQATIGIDTPEDAASFERYLD